MIRESVPELVPLLVGDALYQIGHDMVVGKHSKGDVQRAGHLAKHLLLKTVNGKLNNTTEVSLIRRSR